MQYFVLVLFSVIAITSPFSAYGNELPSKNIIPNQANTQKYAPNRILVTFKPGQSKQELTKQVETRQKERLTLWGSLRQQAQDAFRVGKKKPEEKLSAITALETTYNVRVESFTSSEAAIASSTNTINVQQVVQAFSKLEEVEKAEPDYVKHALFVPNDPLYSNQWGIPMHGFDRAWDVEKGNQNGNIVLAVLDTGVLNSHPDIAAKVRARFDCTTTSGCVSNAGTDVYGHGTAVAGVAAAVTNNSEGIAGAGFNVPMISLKVLGDEGYGYDSWIQNALSYLAANYAGSRVVINMSLGGPEISSYLITAIENAHNAGHVLVAAAGNTGTSTIMYPAGLENVIGVAALTMSGEKAYYSNYGVWVDVAAAGGDQQGGVVTLYNSTQDQYVSAYGSSFAAPFVSAAALLVWSEEPSLTNVGVTSRLRQTADSDSRTGTYWKYGKLNAYRAVTGSGVTSTPTLTPSPTITRTPTPTFTITPTPSTSAGGIGLSIQPSNIQAVIERGSSKKVLDLYSLDQPLFAFWGTPTAYGPGINWVPSSGGISSGSTIPVSISVLSSVPIGVYQGIGVLRNSANQELRFPVVVQVVDPLKSGDVDGDGGVSLTDLSVLLTNFGKSGMVRSQGDLDGNGAVNILDLSQLLENFGT